jgi:hypothetical protein
MQLLVLRHWRRRQVETAAGRRRWPLPTPAAPHPVRQFAGLRSQLGQSSFDRRRIILNSGAATAALVCQLAHGGRGSRVGGHTAGRPSAARWPRTRMCVSGRAGSTDVRPGESLPAHAPSRIEAERFAGRQLRLYSNPRKAPAARALRRRRAALLLAACWQVSPAHHFYCRLPNGGASLDISTTQPAHWARLRLGLNGLLHTLQGTGPLANCCCSPPFNPNVGAHRSLPPCTK